METNVSTTKNNAEVKEEPEMVTPSIAVPKLVVLCTQQELSERLCVLANKIYEAQRVCGNDYSTTKQKLAEIKQLFVDVKGV